jgi:uncharacterized membrane protein
MGVPALFSKLAVHKYKFGIFVLLLAASAVSVALALFRMTRSDSLNYRFLVWNLILAWIPFLFAAIAYASAITRKPIMYIVIAGCAIAWLIFFPNAPYILTDFQHLTIADSRVPVWFDVILLIWFAWTGLLLGIISLYLMQEIVNRWFNTAAGWLFAIVVIGLSSFGIYLGRFGRWNSWDLWQNPIAVLRDVYDVVRHPRANISTVGFTLIFTLFFIFIYIAFLFFGRLTSERQKHKSN